MGRGEVPHLYAQRVIRGSLLPIAFACKRDHVEMQARQGVLAREKDRMRGKPHTVRVGAGFHDRGNTGVIEFPG